MSVSPVMVAKLLKAQVQQLSTGPTINVHVGDGDRKQYLGYPMHTKLLCHFSEFCHDKLIVKKEKFLHLTGLEPVMSIYVMRWIRAGGNEITPAGATSFANMGYFDLLHLLNVSTTLKVEALRKQTMDRLLYLTRSKAFDVEHFKILYGKLAAEATLKDAVVMATINMIWAYTIHEDSYTQYSLTNPEFEAAMNAAWDAKVKANSTSIGKPTKAASVLRCKHCNKHGHVQIGCWKLHKELVPIVVCEVCGKKGHKEATCWKAHKELAPSYKEKAVPCAQCDKYGHHLAECWKLHPRLAPKRSVSHRKTSLDSGYGSASSKGRFSSPKEPNAVFLGGLPWTITTKVSAKAKK
ncbi:MAG: hypothetical protein M1827_007404 [Pycnora praestabilis]|nr:MAG: hypothetical protein M1827_007404 [Pycnora praestabilis]